MKKVKFSKIEIHNFKITLLCYFLIFLMKLGSISKIAYVACVIKLNRIYSQEVANIMHFKI